jgi:transposase
LAPFGFLFGNRILSKPAPPPLHQPSTTNGTPSSEWLQRYQTDGVDGLLEGYRPGRPSELTEKQQQQLGDILDSGPVAYGLDTGIWTSPMIAWVIEEEFGVQYHPGHVRKLLHGWGFSVQRPRRVLARADAAAQDRWHRRIYPALKKKPNRDTGR